MDAGFLLRSGRAACTGKTLLGRLILRVELQGVRPKVWRRVLVPSSIRLPKLHVVLLRVMGWDGGHLHEFEFAEGRYGVPDPDWPDESMDDESIIAELVAIRGIGRWTAEMFLIFHLMRPNVLPLDDVGLIKGISDNYFSGDPVSRSDAREVAAAWEPYRSVATWYIWRSLDPLPVVA